MNLRNFANVLADRQGGINIRPCQVKSKELTREQVIKIFGEVPECSIQYGYVISVSVMKNENYKVVVRRES
ncbi:MAG: hypothetical protein JRE23_08510 [Deltaproteobacteria bacterium]|nr:hypothetical protein [Deltaproteobacteria bacterium]